MKNILKKNIPILSILFLVLLTPSCMGGPVSELNQAKNTAQFSLIALFITMSFLIPPFFFSKEKLNANSRPMIPKVLAIILLVLGGICLAIWSIPAIELIGNVMQYGYIGYGLISLLCYMVSAITFGITTANIIRKK